jgi:nucleoside-diphosphate-sugar epimerase
MSSQNKALVCGAGGFIGNHLVKRLKKEGYWVKGVDLKYPEFSKTAADEFIIGDLRDPNLCSDILNIPYDEVYQLAAEMGGAGFIFTGENDADVMHNSATINLNVLYYGQKIGIKKIFYSSSACVYPKHNQMTEHNPISDEPSAYPAAPDSEYGWEKLFSERLYFSFHRNYGLDVRVARFHNTFGTESAWQGGREKAPAAICRKVAETPDGGEIEIWGDGEQTRTFTYIDDCLEGIRRLMNSKTFRGPVNIGSAEMVSINQLVKITMDIAGKNLSVKHIPGPVGIRGRSCNNELIIKEFGWEPCIKLYDGMKPTYFWVEEQVKKI